MAPFGGDWSCAPPGSSPPRVESRPSSGALAPFILRSGRAKNKNHHSDRGPGLRLKRGLVKAAPLESGGVSLRGRENCGPRARGLR